VRKDKINLNSEVRSNNNARITMEYFLFFKPTLPVIGIVRPDIIICKYDIVITYAAMHIIIRFWRNRYVKRPASWVYF